MRKCSPILHGLALGLLIGTLAVRGASPAQAQTTQTTLLTGVVTSEGEGTMQGVLRTAHAVGSPITTHAVTHEHDRYRCLAGRLVPRRHQNRIRQVGYDLRQPIELEIAADRGATADLHVVKTKDRAARLTNAESLIS